MDATSGLSASMVLEQIKQQGAQALQLVNAAKEGGDAARAATANATSAQPTVEGAGQNVDIRV